MFHGNFFFLSQPYHSLDKDWATFHYALEICQNFQLILWKGHLLRSILEPLLRNIRRKSWIPQLEMMQLVEKAILELKRSWYSNIYGVCLTRCKQLANTTYMVFISIYSSHWPMLENAYHSLTVTRFLKGGLQMTKVWARPNCYVVRLLQGTSCTKIRSWIAYCSWKKPVTLTTNKIYACFSVFISLYLCSLQTW